MKMQPFCSTTQLMAGCLMFLLVSGFYMIDASAQNIFPAPEDSATWWFDGYAGAPPIQFDRDYFYYAGDTIVDGVTYQKLMKEQFRSYGTDWYAYTPTLAGIFRIDSVLNKIYLRRNGVEQLWYDFTLEVGDTLNTLQEWDSFPTIIESIDSVLIDGEFRKRWFLNFGGGIVLRAYYIIEGIGNTAGLVEPGYDVHEGGSEIYCFSIKGNALYPSGQSSCEKSILIGIKDELTKFPLQVYPIPVNNRLTLEWDERLPQNSEWQILTIGGQMVLREKINVSNQLNFDMSHLPNGLYLLKLHATESEYWYSKKISVQH